MTIDVRRAQAAEIRLLRRDVLRPGGSLDPYDYDLRPETMHLGAFEGETVLGCASFYPEPYGDEPRAWRLRGMAVAVAAQRQGVGERVLAAGTAAVLDAGVPLIWATARVTAMPFYLHAGWESVGEEFEYGPARLAHLVILCRPRAPRDV